MFYNPPLTFPSVNTHKDDYTHKTGINTIFTVFYKLWDNSLCRYSLYFNNP